jgi:hypothetical protein
MHSTTDEVPVLPQKINREKDEADKNKLYLAGVIIT